MNLEVSWDGPWTLSFGLSQFHGHGSWLVCEVALKVETPYHDNDLILTPIIYITIKWLAVNLKLPELHMDGFSDGGCQF
jgi:hypothetical protein